MGVPFVPDACFGRISKIYSKMARIFRKYPPFCFYFSVIIEDLICAKMTSEAGRWRDKKKRGYNLGKLYTEVDNFAQKGAAVVFIFDSHR